MSKIVIDISSKDMNTIKDGDILLFNEEKRMFYKQTAKEFWKKHNDELVLIIKRYDEIVKTLEKRIKELEDKENNFENKVVSLEQKHEINVANSIDEHEKQEKEFEEKINNLLEEYTTKNKNITNKLILMVENFIKTGGII